MAAQLRALRIAADMTMTDAATGANISQPTLSRLERAETRAKPNDVRALATYLGAPAAKVEELVTMATQLRRKGWWDAYGETVAGRYSNYIELEAAATSEYTYEPSAIPGLLQTTGYARAISAAILGAEAPVDDLAAVRSRRQDVLTRPTAPLHLNAIIDEAAVRRRYGDTDVMQHQLRHLVDVARHDNVTVRILPLDAPDQPATSGPFVLLEFAPPEPAVVYHEGIRNDLYLEDAADIDCFRVIYSRLEALALTPGQSIRFLASLI